MGGCKSKMDAWENDLREEIRGRRGPAPVFKVLSGIVNFAFILFGLMLIFLGALALADLNRVSSLYKVSLPAGAIALGAFLVLASIIGCIGLKRSSVRFLYAYLFFIGIIIVAEVAIGIAAYVQRDKIPDKLYPLWVALSNSSKDFMQERFDCCGWSTVNDAPGTNCADVQSRNTMAPDLTPTPLLGCRDAIQSGIQSNLNTIGIALLVFAFLEIFGIISSAILVHLLRKDQNVRFQHHNENA